MIEATENPTEKLFQVNLTPEQIERFWSNVDKSGDCWIWMGVIASQGYGVVGFGKQQYKAHRIAYFLKHGPFKNSLLCCHKCDNPKCVNPDHIFTGTHHDNAVDAFSKGRRAVGEKCNLSKLTNDEVLQIVSLHKQGLSDCEIGRRFGIVSSGVRYILTGKSWRHVTGGAVFSERRKIGSRSGEDCGAAKLTSAQVLEIRAKPLTVTNLEISFEFGVSRQTVRSVRNGETWKHLLPKEGLRLG